MKIVSFSFLVLTFACWSTLLPAQSYDESVALSFKYLSDNNLSAAEAALKDAMHSEPANPLNAMLLSNLGTIQRRQGKYDDALTSYTAALGRAPRSVILLANRAELFAEMNQPENALTDYTALLMVDNNNEDALYRRGLLYLRVKNYEAAQTDFERILELNPKTLEGRVGIVSLCKLRGQYDDAETIYFYLMDNYPSNVDLYAGRAELYILMNRPGKALSDINTAIRLQGEKDPNPYLYIIRSRIKELQFEKKSAEEDRVKARELGYSESSD